MKRKASDAGNISTVARVKRAFDGMLHGLRLNILFEFDLSEDCIGDKDLTERAEDRQPVDVGKKRGGARYSQRYSWQCPHRFSLFCDFLSLYVQGGDFIFSE